MRNLGFDARMRCKMAKMMVSRTHVAESGLVINFAPLSLVGFDQTYTPKDPIRDRWTEQKNRVGMWRIPEGNSHDFHLVNPETVRSSMVGNMEDECVESNDPTQIENKDRIVES
jgi:hypothetical protein